ncbi:MAG: peptidoglycan-binding protein [Gemmatales bacterium]|nr:peptidoglycan-binding protein [Gemmatales bacterium]
MVDLAVHASPKRAVQWLQTALGVAADGVIDPKTRAALA